MHHIISFFIRNKYFLLFLILEIIALIFTIQNHSYHKSKFINSSNIITGFIYNKFNIINKYTNLKSENIALHQENNKLHNLLNANVKRNFLPSKMYLDSIKYNQRYLYKNARIINNQYKKATNTLTIDKGKKDSIFQDQGVINHKGIIGIVANTSSHYATVMSILNENTKINARLKKNEHYGTITWNTKNYKIVQLEDIPIQANISVGDTIITDGKSTIFPEGILIGKINTFKIVNNRYQEINIKLFNDMSAVKYVSIITNLEKNEILKLENE